MPDDHNQIGVVYICDERYHSLTEFSIASLAMHHDEPLTIYIAEVGYEQEPSESLISYLESRGHVLKVIHLDRAKMDVERLEAVALHPHISEVTLMKAYAIEAVVSTHDRVAFIDSDVLIMENINLRSQFNFSTSVAAVYDFVSYMPFDGQNLIEHTSRTGVSSEYLNAGFLLIWSERWKARNFLHEYIEKLNLHSRHCPYRHDENGDDPGDCKGADQCAINMMVERDWTPLDLRWNVQKPIRHTEVWKHARIRHYTGHRKFLSKSNINRDRREISLIQKIQREVGLKTSEKITYDYGILYALDWIKYFAETQKYKTVVRMLYDRMARTHNSEL